MAQSLSKLFIHLIFSTKNRDPVLLKEFRAALNAYIAGILKQYDCTAIQIECVEDHIHILFRLARTVAIARVVEEVKKGSSKHLKTLSTALKDFQWQHGYAAFSVSESNVPEVAQYIREQEKHHARMTFQQEFLAFLRKHEIEFDERYVWD